MQPSRMRNILLLGAGAAALLLQPRAHTSQPAYSQMAALDQYLIADRDAEIALARSAAPESISKQATVMVLAKTGFETAVPGTNDFVCIVERSWDAAIGDPNFWNPHLRGPDCFNAAAARSYLPLVLLKTRLALAGKSQPEISQAVQAELQQNQLPPMERGAMSYMMSKDEYLDDRARNWHPHLMFFVPLGMRQDWGAALPGSPILAGDDASGQLTIFMIPVARWSDGTPDANAGQG